MNQNLQPVLIEMLPGTMGLSKEIIKNVYDLDFLL